MRILGGGGHTPPSKFATGNSPPVWDPHKKHQIFQAEQIQKHAARYELNYNRDGSPGTVITYLDTL